MLIKLLLGYILFIVSFLGTYHIFNYFDWNLGITFQVEYLVLSYELLVGFATIYALDITLGSILRFISIPLRCITLGLFNILITAYMIWIAPVFTNLMVLDNFLGVLLFTILMTMMRGILQFIFSLIGLLK